MLKATGLSKSVASRVNLDAGILHYKSNGLMLPTETFMVIEYILKPVLALLHIYPNNAP